MNSVIIVAAGNGRRFGSDVPKQFLEIRDAPIIVHTLKRFENCDVVDEVILVLSKGEIENFQKNIEKFNLKKIVKIVAGGENRAESVQNGLKAVDSLRSEIVAVHDGARPLVSVDEIRRTIEKAKEIGAACLVAKVTDTIKQVNGDKITGTIDRSTLRRALTPQAFRFDILQNAFAQNDAGEMATDECFLVEKTGCEIAIVEGSARNIKITHAEDLKIAEALFFEHEN